MCCRRIQGAAEPTRLADARQALRASGIPFTDLTASNPTRVGIRYEEALLELLADARNLTYTPDALGLPEAREAIATDYARRGIPHPAARVAVTASTSESYSFLFKLLCAPGDSVLVPEPSYPLFRYLTALDGVEARPYRQSAADGWAVDVAALERLVDERTRAVLVVTPNNPTGARIRRDTLGELASRCRERRLALIGDEVFTDYPLTDVDDAARSVLDQHEVLTFGLGGLSKTVGLPQLKLGWIAVGGPEQVVRQALADLEVVADAYLSVSTPVQTALGWLLERGAAVRAQIQDRVTGNYRTLLGVAAKHPACRVPVVEGGWSAVIQAPAIMPDEARAIALLEHDRILVHPGSLFDFEREGYFVISLLPHPAEFDPAIARLLAALDEVS